MDLHFIHEPNKGWFIDLPNWPFAHSNLQMVSGADQLCSFLSDDKENTNIEAYAADDIVPELEEAGYSSLSRLSYGLMKGATYNVEKLDGFSRQIWLCPVTLFVMGKYPRYIYFKKAK